MSIKYIDFLRLVLDFHIRKTEESCVTEKKEAFPKQKGFSSSESELLIFFRLLDCFLFISQT